MNSAYNLDLTGEMAETKVDIFGATAAHSQNASPAAIRHNWRQTPTFDKHTSHPSSRKGT
jgi:hypothetical protein